MIKATPTPDKKPVPSRKKSRISMFTQDFVSFLWEFSVLGLAIGVIIGGAVNVLVQSIVAGIVTPILQLVVPSDALKNLSYTVHGVTFSFGPVINAFINFLIVAIIIFVTMKVFVFRGKKIKKKKLSPD